MKECFQILKLCETSLHNTRKFPITPLRNSKTLSNYNVSPRVCHSLPLVNCSFLNKRYSSSLLSNKCILHEKHQPWKKRPDFILSYTCTRFNNCKESTNKYKHSQDGQQKDKDSFNNNSIERNLLANEQNSIKKRSEDNGVTKNEKKEDIGTIPNIITTTRIMCTPILGYFVMTEMYQWGLTLFVCAGITDLLDGYIARNFKNQRTALGTVLDPLADKILISVLTITLTTVHLIPLWLTLTIVSRDLALVGATFYVRYVTLPMPKTLSRFFDLSLPSAKFYPSTLSKHNTLLQLMLVASSLAAPVFHFTNHPLLQGLGYLTATTTFISAVDYIKTGWSRVKILKHDETRDKQE